MSADQNVKKPQIDKFREAARELGCDESEERFDETLKRIAKAPKREAEKPDKAKT